MATSGLMGLVHATCFFSCLYCISFDSLEELFSLCRLDDGLPGLLVLCEESEAVPQERRVHPVRRQGDHAHTGPVEVEISLKRMSYLSKDVVRTVSA